VIDLPLLPTVLGALALVFALVTGLLLAVAVARLRAGRLRADAELAETRAEAAELRDRVELLARQVTVRGTEPEFVITHVGEPAEEPPVPARIEGRLFADIVLRESVVKAAALAHGLRRAAAPETRNRIRFEVGREIRRARRRRRAELRGLRRERPRDRTREVA